MSAPPLPPHPPRQYGGGNSYDYNQGSSAPPIPPLPPTFRSDSPLAAPRPQRMDPDLPANMARNLDAELYQNQQPQPPYNSNQYTNSNSNAYNPTPGFNSTPGFVMPSHQPPRGPSPLPPPQGAGWSPWAPQAGTFSPPPPANNGYAQPPPQQLQPQPSYQPQHQQTLPYPGSPYPNQNQNPNQNQGRPLPDSLSQSMAGLSFNSAPQGHERNNSGFTSPPPNTHTNPNPGGPSLTAPTPTIPALTSALPTVQSPSHDPALKVAWCRDVIYLVDRVHTSQSSQSPEPTQPSGSSETPTGPVIIHDPALLRLSQVAVPMVLSIASASQTPLPPHVAEAVFLRATFEASGAHPEFVKSNPRSAFRDFETAARAGYHAAWFRLGRDYERFGDEGHARDCFERGVRVGVESCLYRLGMAHLMGQLNLPPNPETALPLLHRAATLSSLACPQPAYVYALLLLNEFTPLASTSISQSLFAPLLPRQSTPEVEARKHLERSAYLHFAPAQYKLGHAYEFASPPFEFDPLLSVEWYSKASQQGEIEADMALSKWFLCGAEGAFEKDEGLAWVFAERAAKKGLPSAEFAMGYYCEVGVGGKRDIDAAIGWYRKASAGGNKDAGERLGALGGPDPRMLGRQEHDTLTENTLVRKRTQAKQRSDQVTGPGQGRYGPGQQGAQGRADGRQVVELIRKNTLPYPGSGAAAPPPGSGPPQGQGQGRFPQEQPYQQQNQGVPAARPRPPKEGAASRPFPNQNRYTLTDSPTPPPGGGGGGAGRTSSPASRPNSGAAGGRPGRVPQADAVEPPRRPAPANAGSSGKPGPTTFAEMGITGAKAEDKECRVM